MRDTPRLIATTIIWIAFTVMMGIIAAVLITTDGPLDAVAAGIIFAIVLTLAAAVTKSTNAIWQMPARVQDDYEHTASKSKRHRPDRMERLIEALDDDDIYDLETLLLARDEALRGTNHTARHA